MPAIAKDIKQQIEVQKERQKFYYNKGSRELKEINNGETVRMQPTKLGEKIWKKARCIER